MAKIRAGVGGFLEFSSDFLKKAAKDFFEEGDGGSEEARVSEGGSRVTPQSCNTRCTLPKAVHEGHRRRRHR